MADSQGRYSFGPLEVVANCSATELRNAIQAIQRGLAGDGSAIYAESDNKESPTVIVNRTVVGTGGADVFQVRYLGQRGLYANEFGCARARSPVSNQYAFRAQSHASAGANQEIGAFSLSDNTDILVTKVNGDTEFNRDIRVGRNIVLVNNAWTALTLGTNIVAGTAIAPSSRLELSDRVFLRGSLSWLAATIGANSVLATVAAAHRPTTAKRFSVRTSPTSNVAIQLELAADGTIINVGASLGTTTTANIGLDGLNYDLS